MDILKFVRVAFPKEEGNGSLVHYGLITEAQMGNDGGPRYRVAYITSKKVDMNTNSDPWTKEVSFNDDTFGKDWFRKTGILSKADIKGSRICLNKTAWFSARQLQEVGQYDITNPAAARVLRRAVENCV